MAKDLKVLHQALNATYEMDLFDSEIDFIFENGASKIRLKNLVLMGMLIIVIMTTVMVTRALNFEYSQIV